MQTTKPTKKFELISTLKKAESLLQTLKPNSNCSLHPENSITFSCECKNFHCSKCLKNNNNLSEKCISNSKLFSIDFLVESFAKHLKDLKAFTLFILKKESCAEENTSKINTLVNEIERTLNVFILISLEKQINSSIAIKDEMNTLNDDSDCACIENFSIINSTEICHLTDVDLKDELSEVEVKKAKKFNKKVTEINKLLEKLLKNKKKFFAKKKNCAEEIQKLKKRLGVQTESEADYRKFLLKEIPWMNVNMDNACIALVHSFLNENYFAKLLEAISACEIARNFEKNKKHCFQLKGEYIKLSFVKADKLDEAQDFSLKKDAKIKLNFDYEKDYAAKSIEKASAQTLSEPEPHLLKLENANNNNKNNKIKFNFIRENESNKIERSIEKETSKSSLTNLIDKSRKSILNYVNTENIPNEKSKLEKFEEIKNNLFKIAQRKDIKIYQATKNQPSFQNLSNSNNNSNPQFENVFTTSSKESEENHSLNKSKENETSAIENLSKKLRFEPFNNDRFNDKSANCLQNANDSIQKQSSISANDSSDKTDNSDSYKNSLLEAQADKLNDGEKRNSFADKRKKSKNAAAAVKNAEFFSISNSLISEYCKQVNENAADVEIQGEDKSIKIESSEAEAEAEAEDFSNKESTNNKADSADCSFEEGEIVDNKTKENEEPVANESNERNRSSNVLSKSFADKFNKFKKENFPDRTTHKLKEAFIIFHYKRKILHPKKRILEFKERTIRKFSCDKSDCKQQTVSYKEYSDAEDSAKVKATKNQVKITSKETFEEFLRKNKNEKVFPENISINLQTLNLKENFSKNHKESNSLAKTQTVYSYSKNFKNSSCNFSNNSSSKKPQKQTIYSQTNKHFKNKNDFKTPIINNNENYKKKENPEFAFSSQSDEKQKIKKEKRKESETNQPIPQKVLIQHQEKLLNKKEFKISMQSVFKTKKKIDLDSHVIHLAEDSESSMESEEISARGKEAKDESDYCKRKFNKPIKKKFFNENKFFGRGLYEGSKASEEHFKDKLVAVKNKLKAAEAEKSYRTSKIEGSVWIGNKENCDPNTASSKNPKQTLKNFNFELNKSENSYYKTSESRKSFDKEKFSDKSWLKQKEPNSKIQTQQQTELDSKQLLNLLLLLSKSESFDASALNNVADISAIQKALAAFSATNQSGTDNNLISLPSKIQSIFNSCLLSKSENPPHHLLKIHNYPNKEENNNQISEKAYKSNCRITEEKITKIISIPKKPLEKAKSDNNFIFTKDAESLNAVKFQKADFFNKNDTEDLLRKALTGYKNSSVIKAKEDFCVCVECGARFILNNRSCDKNPKCDDCELSSD